MRTSQAIEKNYIIVHLGSDTEMIEPRDILMKLLMETKQPEEVDRGGGGGHTVHSQKVVARWLLLLRILRLQTLKHSAAQFK